MPNTDGGAQDRWQKYLEKTGKITEGAVSLEEVAKGMVKFSSNANAEYLMELLGLDNINRNLQSLSLPAHQPLFPIVSSLYIPGYLHKKLHVPKYKIEKKLKEMSQEQYREYAMIIHERLKKKVTIITEGNSALFRGTLRQKFGQIDYQQLLQMIIWYYFKRQTIKVA